MDPFVLLAKTAVETYIKEGKIISLPEKLPKEFYQRKAGVFVTIEKNNQLRGCIGTYLSTRENIGTEILSNAISAAIDDYRFDPVKKEELPHLSYSVYILGNPEPVKDILKLDPKKFGVIVKTQGFSSPSDAIFSSLPKPYQKTGLLLPDLEGIDTSEKQISIACQKAGINPKEEKFIIYKFSVEKHQ